MDDKLRPVLEALQATASDVALGHDGVLSIHARKLVETITAALAPDAEKTQGELCPECNGTGGFGPGGFCPNSGEWQGEVCEECGGTGKPREPAAAPDAELDRLISEYGRAHARAMELLSWPNDTLQCRAAIHAHVERVKREAREAGERAATGEVVGTARVIRYATDALTPGHQHHRIVNVRTSLQAGDEVDVDLVRRRGKEDA